MANRVVSMLTDRQAKLAKKTIAVGGVKGLTLRVRVRATGSGISKFFAMRMIVDGKEVIQTIGQYPQVKTPVTQQLRRPLRTFKKPLKNCVNAITMLVVTSKSLKVTPCPRPMMSISSCMLWT